MDKDTKILLMAVVIILVALVSFNLTDMTGKTVNSMTTLTVSPAIIEFGEHDTAKIITVRVSPGSRGINRKLQMYRVKTGGYNIAISTETATACLRNTCYEDLTISYRLQAGLMKGKYYFQAKNRDGEKYASNIIEIK